nr:hypothetical protein [uncultured Desulfobulbus sp.]
MNIKSSILSIGKVQNNLLSNLESRDVALWIRSLPKKLSDDNKLVRLMCLPWQLIMSEISDSAIIAELESQSNNDVSMVRKRGFAQIIDSDPSRIDLPQRCLPIYLLNGRRDTESSDFVNQLRRMTMLENLRRSGIREILFISGDVDPIPPDFKDLWTSGFRTHLTFVTDNANSQILLENWLSENESNITLNLSYLPVEDIINDIVERYTANYPEDRHIIRVRDQKGVFHNLDITDADDPERPVLHNYTLIQDRDLEPLLEDELLENEFIDFFHNPEGSWRPYAAGLPWVQKDEWKNRLESYLKKIDISGAGESCIVKILSEAGAGGTTIARTLAWESARQGYPVLLAKSIPFTPDALTIGNFLNRIRLTFQELNATTGELAKESANIHKSENKDNIPQSYYETPWIIVFDRQHWEDRESELVRFRNEMEKQGRPVCILVVAGPMRSLTHFAIGMKEIAELSHSIDQEDALELGKHLNRFLRVYGKERAEWQWNQFYHSHTIRYLEGIAAFWVTLSFWIQGQYDLSESIQEWIYRKFKEENDDRVIRNAIFEIAALSSERLPLPDGLLTTPKGSWPVSQLLEDHRSNLGAIGLVRISANGEKYWALTHDILGRFLINALYYDFPLRKEYGFSEAKDSDHLRFLLLRQISKKRELGERFYRTIGEDFATSVFKIDPDHGRGSFVKYWREVLEALEAMPRSLIDTSRVFRHHLAVSRRRITKLDVEFYGVTKEDKILLLSAAIEDINYALHSIEYSPGSESDINLYNSLANAYLDLAKIESESGASRTRIVELNELANEATRKVYEQNPDNSFVIETYVKNKLANAKEFPEVAVDYCIEILGVLYSIISSNEGEYRRSRLADYADQALNFLFQQIPTNQNDLVPTNAVEVLVKTWTLLVEGVDGKSGIDLADLPENNRERALSVLEHPAGHGNLQILRLIYDLTCISKPGELRRQLDLAEQLVNSPYRTSPQLQLEYGLLLYQNIRSTEGQKVFQTLRRLWRENEYFVQVPERLRWLRDLNNLTLKTVQAFIGSDYGNRSMARVREFGDQQVPFRPEEFGFRELRPRMRFSCHVFFGHNGPFLRPVTASAKRSL